MFSAKRTLCFSLAALMAVPAMMTGCKSTTKAGSGSPVTVTYWSAGTQQNGIDRINTAINDYLKKKNENVRLNFQLMGWGDDYEKKVNTMLTAGGSDADIVFTCNWVNPYRSNANKGYYVNLTNDLKTTEGKKIVEVLGQDFLDGSKIKGINYALPCNKEKAHDWGFLVRTDLATQFGMDTTKIKTMTDLEPYLEKAKSVSGVTPLCIAAFDGPWHFLDWDMVSDDKIPIAISYDSDKNGTVIDPFIDPKSVDLYKQMKTYYDKGYISKDATTKSGVDDELKTGKYFVGVDSLKPGKDKEMSSSSGIQYTQIDITTPVKSNRETTGSMIAINNFSKNKDAAFHMMYLLYTDKTLVNLITYGVEGTDYTKNSNGSITPNSKSDYVFQNGWMVGNQLNNLLLSTEDPQKWSNFQKYNDSAKALPSLGFMFDDSNVTNEESACKNVIDTYYKQLIAGAVPNVDSTVTKMTSDLKSSGIDKLIAEAQSQYTSFLSSKK